MLDEIKYGKRDQTDSFGIKNNLLLLLMEENSKDHFNGGELEFLFQFFLLEQKIV